MFRKPLACWTLLAIVVSAVLVPSPAPAREESAAAPGSAEIVGKVRAAGGKKAVAGAVVRAYHLDTATVYTAEPTGAKGRYRFRRLPHGYFEMSVETADGLFVGDHVVNLPPAGKVAVSFTLSPYAEGAPGPWQGSDPREVLGLDRTASGRADLEEGRRGREFWKSPTGVAIIAGGAGAALLSLASGSDPFRPVSPTDPEE